jgi:UDP-N-acetylglucosamine 2-epimerase (non-hydrolysing)
LKATFVIGTRPEIIKTFPVIKAAEKNKYVDVQIVHSGQHYDFELSKVFFGELTLPDPNFYLEVGSGSHGQQTADTITKFEEILQKTTPDLVFVQGDTNSAMAGALAASKCSIPVAHIEAGCRSFDWNMPEEVNRVIIDSIATLCFAPSHLAVENLLFEGKFSHSVFMCGNTAVDSCEFILQSKTEPLDFNRMGLEINEKVRYAVLTLHRFENVDNLETLSSIFNGIIESPYEVVFPAHPRTLNRLREFGLVNKVESCPRIHFVKPLSYSTFIQLIQNAEVILTDSGGIQVEASILNVPCLTLRDTTEWYETVSIGANKLVGTKSQVITETLRELHESDHKREQMSKTENPFEGNAGSRIMKTLIENWKKGNLVRKPPDMKIQGYPRVTLLTQNQIKKIFNSTSLYFSDSGDVPEVKEKAERFVVRKKKNGN